MDVRRRVVHRMANFTIYKLRILVGAQVRDSVIRGFNWNAIKLHRIVEIRNFFYWSHAMQLELRGQDLSHN